MTQEEKQLLLKDLCARLPYKVKCVFHNSKGDIPSTILKVDIESEAISHSPNGGNIIYYHYIEDIKLYLRPMTSMTEKEVVEFESVTEKLLEYGTSEEIWDTVIDWLNVHYFDHRHLIEKGLAIEAPKGMYKTK